MQRLQFETQLTARADYLAKYAEANCMDLTKLTTVVGEMTFADRGLFLEGKMFTVEAIREKIVKADKHPDPRLGQQLVLDSDDDSSTESDADAGRDQLALVPFVPVTLEPSPEEPVEESVNPILAITFHQDTDDSDDDKPIKPNGPVKGWKELRDTTDYIAAYEQEKCEPLELIPDPSRLDKFVQRAKLGPVDGVDRASLEAKVQRVLSKLRACKASILERIKEDKANDQPSRQSKKARARYLLIRCAQRVLIYPYGKGGLDRQLKNLNLLSSEHIEQLDWYRRVESQILLGEDGGRLYSSGDPDSYFRCAQYGSFKVEVRTLADLDLKLADCYIVYMPTMPKKHTAAKHTVAKKATKKTGTTNLYNIVTSITEVPKGVNRMQHAATQWTTHFMNKKSPNYDLARTEEAVRAYHAEKDASLPEPTDLSNASPIGGTDVPMESYEPVHQPLIKCDNRETTERPELPEFLRAGLDAAHGLDSNVQSTTGLAELKRKREVAILDAPDAVFDAQNKLDEITLQRLEVEQRMAKRALAKAQRLAQQAEDMKLD